MATIDIVFFAMGALTFLASFIFWPKFAGDIWDEDDMDDFEWFAMQWFMRAFLSLAVGALWIVVLPIAAVVGFMRWVWSRQQSHKRDRKGGHFDLY